jgi:hypothetical protein
VLGNQVHSPPAGIAAFSMDACIAEDWSPVNIRVEAGISPDGRPGVQMHVEQWMVSRFPGSTIIRDDGPGEIADLVAFREEGGAVNVRLIHCKWSSEDAPGARLDDIHDLVCQASRSVRWARSQVIWEELNQRLGQRSYTELRQGDPEAVRLCLRRWAERPPRTEFTVYAVQPGLRIDRIPTWIEGSNLLSSCQKWILDQAAAELVVIGS